MKVEGKLASFILESHRQIALFAPSFMFTETIRHSKKVASIAGISERDLLNGLDIISGWITIVPDREIFFEDWQMAAQLVRDIDEDDIPYVACSLFLGIPLWTGDKKLREGLIAKGYQKAWSTIDLKQALDEVDENRI